MEESLSGLMDGSADYAPRTFHSSVQHGLRILPRRLRVIFAVSLALSLVAGAIFVADVIGVRETAAGLDRDRVLAQRLETVLLTLVDAETGQRGFLLTGRPSYLEPYVRAAQDYRENLASLRALAADDPGLQQALSGLEPLVEKELTGLALSIDQYWKQGPQAAVRMVETDDGKRTMDAIRAIISSAHAELANRVAAATSAGDRRTMFAFLVALVAGGINTVVFIVLYRAVAAYHLERERADQAFRESTALLRAITEGTEDWVFAKDRAGRLILANPPVLKSFGKPASEVLGKVVRDYVPDPAEAAAIHDNDMRVMESGRSETIEQTITLAGHVRTYMSTKSPHLDDNGRVIGLIGIATDITARKGAELALQRAHDQLAHTVDERTAELTELTQYLMRVSEEEKQKLAAEMHDELGSLLTVIGMDAERVLKRLKTLDPDLAERQQNIVQLVREAANLKRRIIEGMRPLLLEQFGLMPALRDYLRQWSESSAITLRQELPETLASLRPDVALAFYRVVQESLTNVAKYASARNVRISLAQTDTEVVLVIEDDGIGIDPDILTRPTSHGVIGMRHRVAHFGGSLAVERVPAGGTRVTARMPL